MAFEKLVVNYEVTAPAVSLEQSPEHHGSPNANALIYTQFVQVEGGTTTNILEIVKRIPLTSQIFPFTWP